MDLRVTVVGERSYREHMKDFIYGEILNKKTFRKTFDVGAKVLCPQITMENRNVRHMQASSQWRR